MKSGNISNQILEAQIKDNKLVNRVFVFLLYFTIIHKEEEEHGYLTFLTRIGERSRFQSKNFSIICLISIYTCVTKNDSSI